MKVFATLTTVTGRTHVSQTEVITEDVFLVGVEAVKRVFDSMGAGGGGGYYAIQHEDGVTMFPLMQVESVRLTKVAS